MQFLETISTTLPVILVVAVGMGLRRVKLVGPGVVAGFKSLVVNLTLPLVLFKAFASMQFEARYLLIVGSVFVACTLVMFASARLRFLPGLSEKYASYLMAGFEAGMLGYAVFGSIYGEAAIPRFAVIDLGQVLFVFLVLITRLKYSQSGRLSIGQTLGLFVRTPVIIGIGAGILANVSGLYALAGGWALSASLLRTGELLGGLTLPLVALSIGYELRFQAGSLAKPLLTVGLRLVVWAGLALAFNTLVMGSVLGLDHTFQAAVLLMAILPAPFVVPLYLKEGEGKEREYIINVLSLGTVAALIGAVGVRLIY